MAGLPGLPRDAGQDTGYGRPLAGGPRIAQSIVGLAALLGLLAGGLSGDSQEPPPLQIQELVEQLSAEGPQKRTHAEEELKRLGASAIPFLERAAQGQDPELSHRAREVLRAIEIRRGLSLRLLAEFPDIDRGLPGGSPEAWTRAFLRATEAKDGVRLHPNLNGLDLSPLASGALRGASSPEATLAVLDALGDLRIIEAADDVARLLTSEDPEIEKAAIISLGKMGARKYRQALHPRLLDERTFLRGEALWALGAMRATESIRDIEGLLDQPLPDLWPTAIRVLGDLDAQTAIPALRRLRTSQDPAVRAEVLTALGALGDQAMVSEIASFASDRSERVRGAVARSLARLGAADRQEELLRLLRDPSPTVQRAAAAALGRLRCRPALSALQNLLRESRGYPLKCAAATSLCELGSRDGLAYLLESTQEYDVLNALRKPELWNLLDHPVLTREAEGESRQLLEFLLREIGWTLELPRASDPILEGGLRCRKILSRKGRSTSLLSAVRDLTEGWGAVVLEERTLRILSLSEALAFWKAWAVSSEPR